MQKRFCLYHSACYVKSHNVTSCHVILCHVMSCHVMSHHIMSHHVMLCHVMSCHVTSHNVTSCHVMSHTLQPHYLSVSHPFCSLHIDRPSESVVILQAHVFIVILTPTKVVHGACINHNILINTEPIQHNFFVRGWIHFRAYLLIELQLTGNKAYVDWKQQHLLNDQWSVRIIHYVIKLRGGPRLWVALLEVFYICLITDQC